MEELNLTSRERKLLSSWEKYRGNKLKFIVINGLFRASLPTLALVLFLYIVGNKLSLAGLLAIFFCIIMLNIFLAQSQFKQLDRLYLFLLRKNKKIAKGVEKLKLAGEWSFENILLRTADNNTLLIRNLDYWFDQTVAPSDKIKECHELINEDFQQLKENKDFKEFAQSHKILFQLFDSPESETPIMEIKM